MIRARMSVFLTGGKRNKSRRWNVKRWSSWHARRRKIAFIYCSFYRFNSILCRRDKRPRHAKLISFEHHCRYALPPRRFVIVRMFLFNNYAQLNIYGAFLSRFHMFPVFHIESFNWTLMLRVIYKYLSWNSRSTFAFFRTRSSSNWTLINCCLC